MLRNRRGQSTLEYALVIAAAVAALLALNIYLRRGISGRLKESSDQIGKQFIANEGYSSSWESQSAGQTVTEEIRDADQGGTLSSVTNQSEVVTRGEHDTFGQDTAQHY